MLKTYIRNWLGLPAHETRLENALLAIDTKVGLAVRELEDYCKGLRRDLDSADEREQASDQREEITVKQLNLNTRILDVFLKNDLLLRKAWNTYKANEAKRMEKENRRIDATGQVVGGIAPGAEMLAALALEDEQQQDVLVGTNEKMIAQPEQGD